MLSSSQDEVRRLIVRAREWAERLGLPVKLWISDKQDAFVKGIAQEFPDVPHRYCQNHFLRNLAKPTLEKDSRAKVQMRKKVRGLRDIEREVLEQRRERKAEQAQIPAQDEARQQTAPAAVQGTAATAADSLGKPDAGVCACSAGAAGQEGAPLPEPCSQAEQTGAGNDVAEQVVLDYCAAVRGISTTPGRTAASAGPAHGGGVTEVQESLQRNLELKKPGPAHGQLEQPAECIESGLASVKAEQEEVRQQVKEIAKVEAKLNQDSGTRTERRTHYENLQRVYQAKQGESRSPGTVDGELAAGTVPGAASQEGGEGPGGQPGVGAVVPQAQEAREEDPRAAARRGTDRPGGADSGPGTRRSRCTPRAVHGRRTATLLASGGAARATRSPPAQEDHAPGWLEKKRNPLLES